MLKIENTEVLGWEHAIHGMRNPMNRLRNAGTDHRKFMRMITVYVDLTGPLYWWKEFDTYKVRTVAIPAPQCTKLRRRSLRWRISAMSI